MDPNAFVHNEIPAVADEAYVGLERMGFRVGPLSLLIPWDGGREVMSPISSSHIPNTVSWCQGLINVRGALMPVIDTAAAFGVTRTSGVPVYLLVVGTGENAMGLLIDGLPSQVNVEPAARLPDLPVGLAMLNGSITAAYEHADRVWIEVNLDALFENLARHIVL